MPVDELYTNHSAGHAPTAAPGGQPPRPAPESRVFRDAQADARNASRDTLQAFAGTFTSISLDPEADLFERFNASERLRAFEQEIASRHRVDRLTNREATRVDRNHAAWSDLAAIVKERVDILEVFTHTGYPPHDVRPAEAHAPCPVCGGTDRLVIRRDPPGRCWCRACGWSGDTIAVAMSLNQCGFRDAVRWLADIAGEQAVPA